jgi:hypothetical protein
MQKYKKKYQYSAKIYGRYGKKLIY